MKQLLFCLFSILISSSVSVAQVVWENGTRWEYESYTFSDPESGTSSIEVLKDTLVNGINCKLILHDTYSCTMRPVRDIIYHEGDKVFFFHQEDQSFYPLYDFGMAIGDTLQLRLWEGHASNYDYAYFRLDTISNINLSGQDFRLLRYQIGLEEDGVIEFLNFSYDVIDGVGCTDHLFYFYDTGFCDGTYVSPLLCFYHPNTGLSAINDDLCTLSSTEDLTELTIQIYPNPATHHLHLSSSATIKSIQVIDIHGQIVLSQSFAPVIDVSHLPAGVYYIRGNPSLGAVQCPLYLVR